MVKGEPAICSKASPNREYGPPKTRYAGSRTGVLQPVSATGSSEPAKASWFREALKDKGIRACIPGRTSRGKAVRYDKRRYRRRNRIEIMFGRPKDWRRVATRYDRCGKTVLSTVALAETVVFWLSRSMSLDPS